MSDKRVEERTNNLEESRDRYWQIATKTPSGSQHAHHTGVGRKLAKARNKRPLKVLVLDEEIPYPPNAGKRIRTWNLLQRLAKRHSVCLLCYGQPSDSAAKAVQTAGIRLCLVAPKVPLTAWQLYLRLFLNLFSPRPFSVAKHFSSAFQKQLRSLLNEEHWDLVQCEWTPYACFVSRTNDTPVLVTTHNVESQIWDRRARHVRNPLAKMFFRMQAWKMQSFEKRALRRASGVTAVTAQDALIMRGWGIENVGLVPNGVDLKSYVPAAEFGREGEDEILLLASLDWYPNVDALDYFTTDIFPLLRARNSQAVLRIVGRRPPKELQERFSGVPGVDFVGEVEDVRENLTRAAVVVVPLRIGGGSRIKILEALAARKAVVTTSIGAEGLDVVSGKHLIIADSPADFACGIARLLASKQLRRQFADQGQKLVRSQYGWDDIAGRLELAWQRVAKNQPSRESAFLTPHAVQRTP